MNVSKNIRCGTSQRKRVKKKEFCGNGFDKGKYALSMALGQVKFKPVTQNLKG